MKVKVTVQNAIVKNLSKYFFLAFNMRMRTNRFRINSSFADEIVIHTIINSPVKRAPYHSIVNSLETFSMF